MKPTIIFSNYDDIDNPTFGGGGAISIDEVTKRLVKKYQVKVIVGHYHGAKNKTINDVEYKYIGTSIFGHQIGQFIYQLILPYYALTLKYALWIDNLTPPVSLGLIPLFSHSPVIGLVHMLPGLDMKRKYHLPFDLIEKFTLRFYSHFIVTTPEFATQLKYLNKRSTIKIIPNGVNLPTILKRGQGKYLLYMGRIDINQKGLDLLLSAYERIPAKLRIPLYIAGSGDKTEINKLQKLVVGHPLSKQVSLLGKVTGSGKYELFKNARAVIVPSRFETFSLTSLEALSYGLSLVTFDLPGLAWIPKHLRYVANSLTSSSLVSVISKSLSHSQTTSDKSKAIDFARLHSWDNSAKLYLETIKGILS